MKTREQCIAATTRGIAESNAICAGMSPLPDHLLARAAKLLEVEQIDIKHPNKDAA